jgi:asparagine synthase (glutamine-hydrolysing)
MCGIAGVVAPAERERGRERVAQMLETLRHRGPDDEGIVEAALGVWLGNRRLAILDLSPAGHMPMAELGSGLWITYNGEVYNFADLRRELEGLGFSFRSRTDTEVVLASWGAWGREALRRLRGMFALAVFDPRHQELVLARDPLGEKPLYYASGPGWFAFASEVRALLASGLVARRLDLRALACYLHNGFLVDPLTLVEGIRALLPGHLLRVRQDGSVGKPERFWRGPFFEGAEQAPDLEALRARFVESVRLRLVADVPVGVFLSGGLDSTAVAGAAVRSGQALATLTVAIPGSSLDESAHARRVAEKLGTDHREINIGSQEIVDWVLDGLAALDQPSFDGINTYLVARAAKAAGLTVALTGLGGDELFGGYPFLRHAAIVAGALGAMGSAGRVLAPLASLARLSGPAKLLTGLDVEDRDLIDLASYQATQALFAGRLLRYLLSERPSDVQHGLPVEFISFLGDERVGAPLPDRLSHLALRLFLGQRTLRDSDAVSMAVSLELRPPFVDRIFVEEVFSLPAVQRCRGMPDKAFERELLGPLLPPGYPRRRKQGFVLPFSAWVATDGPLAQFVRERLEDPGLLVRAGLRGEAVASLLRHREKLPWSRVWALVALLDWIGRNGLEA